MEYSNLWVIRDGMDLNLLVDGPETMRYMSKLQVKWPQQVYTDKITAYHPRSVSI